MLTQTLDLLRCPFCGTRLSVIENAALDRSPDRIESAVLGCECCAFPVLAGIPVMIADDATRDAIHALEAGRRDDALHMLLGLDETRCNVFRRLTSGDREPTYRELLDVLCLDAEADYMLHRFSDPTALLVEALLDGLGTAGLPGAARNPPAATASPSLAGAGTSLPPTSMAPPPNRGRSAFSAGLALDLCGGCGHLTRVLLRQPACAGAVLADLHFWKLWLAARFLAPESDPVCCDANNPLPFTDGLFSTVLLSDAFPYIWHKRLLAGEMQRAAIDDGVIVMPHLHSAHGENYSAGDTLSPTAYANLFTTLGPKLFDDRTLLDGVLAERVLDLLNDVSPGECGDTPSTTLLATRDAALYRRFDVLDPIHLTGVLTVNPLYRVDYQNGVSRLTLTFPTPEYEQEFGLAKRYLPASLAVEADLRGATTPADVGPPYGDLRRRRVLIDAPRGYC